MTKIIDNDTDIAFYQVTDINKLTVGAIVQIVENNKNPLAWSWVELDEHTISLIKNRNALKFVRLVCFERGSFLKAQKSIFKSTKIFK